jgi:hypothetical protein
MTSRIHIMVRVYCQQCDEHFDAELPAVILPVTASCRLELMMPEQISVPRGWYQKYAVALCPKHNPHPPRPQVKETPTAEIVERARALQALAINKAAGEGERANAWEAFEKLWKRYDLPPELGLEDLGV